MNKKAIIGLVIGLIIGIGGTIGATALMNSNAGKDNSSMSMADMNAELKGKTGDDFDKAFIEMMIEHHQGAIDMAILAKSNAKHDEIKTLSQDIISAQTNEISKMQQWQMDWSYMSASDSMPGMTH
jgi:uncharacterized protein (DUF305 family)